MANGSVRRRRGPRALLVGFAVMVVLAVVGVVVIRWMGQPDSDNYASVRDTAGPAKGQAHQLTEAMRARGLACSDQYLDAKTGYSRGCYRTDFKHDVAVEFSGPAEGLLDRVSVLVDYAGAKDVERVHRDLDDLAADVVRSAALSPADADTVSRQLATGKTQQFRLGWGKAGVTRGTAASAMQLTRTGWTKPVLSAGSKELPGSLEAVARSAVQRGYSCPDPDPILICTRHTDDAELKLIAMHGHRSSLARLYVSADTGRKDRAMELALAEQAAVLDGLGGPRSAEVKAWFAGNAGVAGGRGFVGGMRAYIKVVDDRSLHYVQLDLNA